MSVSNIQSSLLAMQVYGTTKTSQPSTSTAGLDPAADIFGSAVSYDLSDQALSSLGLGGIVEGDSLDSIFASLSYAGFATGISQSESKEETGDSIDALLALFGTGSVSSVSNVDSVLGIGSEGDGFIRGDGPLPAFLAMVKSQLGLSTEQSLALDNIALKFREADDTPETVAAIAAELSAAGITA